MTTEALDIATRAWSALSIEIAVGLGAFLMIVWLMRRVSRRWVRKRSHVRRQRQAQRVLAKLMTIPEPRWQIAYLRKIDPFTFEELILEAFEQRGERVQRNHRYTGDGGVDGRVWLDGKLHLVQAKRYSGHIDLGHVREFGTLVNRNHARGLFVHTGKTGRSTREEVRNLHNVQLISGNLLLRLLNPASTPSSEDRRPENPCS